MDKKVRMITAVPQQLATVLVQKKRIMDYNTLPQINKDLLETIRTYLGEYVGYENAPIACLSRLKHEDVGIKKTGAEITHYIPVNAKNSIIFELKMPEDCIVSIEYANLLDYSQQLDNASDVEKQFILEAVKEELQVGLADNLEEAISFIPFIELEKCQFFATLNSAFESNGLQLPGIEEVNLHELTSFYR